MDRWCYVVQYSVRVSPRYRNGLKPGDVVLQTVSLVCLSLHISARAIALAPPSLYILSRKQTNTLEPCIFKSFKDISDPVLGIDL